MKFKFGRKFVKHEQTYFGVSGTSGPMGVSGTPGTSGPSGYGGIPAIAGTTRPSHPNQSTEFLSQFISIVNDLIDHNDIHF